jgi:hypothetical protein
MGEKRKLEEVSSYNIGKRGRERSLHRERSRERETETE